MIIKNNKRLLIIDDSIDNQELLKLLFEEKGFQVYTTSNGVEALSLLEKLSYLPELILLDAQMPIMDGFQFRIEQNKINRIKNIPVIVITAEDDYATEKKMNFPVHILVKPLQINSLVESVMHFS